MKNVFHRLLCDDDGQDLIEYALLAALIALAAITRDDQPRWCYQRKFSSVSSSSRGFIERSLR